MTYPSRLAPCLCSHWKSTGNVSCWGSSSGAGSPDPSEPIPPCWTLASPPSVRMLLVTCHKSADAQWVSAGSEILLMSLQCQAPLGMGALEMCTEVGCGSCDSTRMLDIPACFKTFCCGVQSREQQELSSNQGSLVRSCCNSCCR